MCKAWQAHSTKESSDIGTARYCQWEKKCADPFASRNESPLAAADGAMLPEFFTFVEQLGHGGSPLDSLQRIILRSGSNKRPPQ